MNWIKANMPWISVDDKLPELYKGVIIFRKAYKNKDGIFITQMHPTDQYLLSFYTENGWFFDTIYSEENIITHWMPLIEPHKEMKFYFNEVIPK